MVEVLLADSAQLDALVATGVDLDHHVTRPRTASSCTPWSPATRSATLRPMVTGRRQCFSPADSAARLSRARATIAAHQAENQAFTRRPWRQAAGIGRKDHPGRLLHLRDRPGALGRGEVGRGPDLDQRAHRARDSGPGTEIGSGGTQSITRFVDAGVYLYHRGAATGDRPGRSTSRSPAPPATWPWPRSPSGCRSRRQTRRGPGYQKDFVTSYLTPTELYDADRAARRAVPGARRDRRTAVQDQRLPAKAQAVLGTRRRQPGRVDSLAWGHEGGNDISRRAGQPGRRQPAALGDA